MPVLERTIMSILERTIMSIFGEDDGLLQLGLLLAFF